MSDNSPHFNRWCVVDTVPIEKKDGLFVHIYCSFADEGLAKLAAGEMNHLVRRDPKAPNRTSVHVIYYSHLKDE